MPPRRSARIASKASRSPRSSPANTIASASQLLLQRRAPRRPCPCRARAPRRPSGPAPGPGRAGSRRRRQQRREPLERARPGPAAAGCARRPRAPSPRGGRPAAPASWSSCGSSDISDASPRGGRGLRTRGSSVVHRSLPYCPSTSKPPALLGDPVADAVEVAQREDLPRRSPGHDRDRLEACPASVDEGVGGVGVDGGLVRARRRSARASRRSRGRRHRGRSARRPRRTVRRASGRAELHGPSQPAGAPPQ